MAAGLFVAFWVLLALGLFFLALRGGARGAREALQVQSYRARRLAIAGFLAVFAVLGIGVPAVLLIGNHDNASAQYAGVKLTSGDRHGRDIFGLVCSSCHTLKAARANGKVGPNLDQLRPPKALVLDALAKGRQRGNGTMPPGLVQGTDAQDVASFVSKVAGR
jgi:mono/diheme cytochrome c family protein